VYLQYTLMRQSTLMDDGCAASWEAAWERGGRRLLWC